MPSEVEKLKDEIERLKAALMRARSGMDLAYDAVSKRFCDEALVHLGHHSDAIDNVLKEIK